MKIIKGWDITQQTRFGDHTAAGRSARYREAHREEYRERDAARKRASRATAIPEFIAVDSEGIGDGKYHRAVLLGVGQDQYVAKDLTKGLQYDEVFSFLYEHYESNPDAAYVGFFLGYDFNSWLGYSAGFPQDKAWLLLSPEGRAVRKYKDKSKGRRFNEHPVRTGDWEIMMLGFKRLSIRPQICHCAEQKHSCNHEQKGWMHICDAGSFFQMSLLSALNPHVWADDPDGQVCTTAEYELVKKGKERRATANLDEEMKMYNRLENELLSRLMNRLAKGFVRIGIRLGKDQWYGPGASASKWLSQKHAVKHNDLGKFLDDELLEACRKSYFGGWFEIFSHGLILGSSYNYDINNAYPHAATMLPHICDQGSVRSGIGEPANSGRFTLVYVTVKGSNDRIGPVPYRDKKGAILRPKNAKGWYWLGELQAAERAGLVGKVEYHEWIEYRPCNHKSPFGDIHTLYNERRRVGKSSAQGMAIKLTNNSIYGKFAQSIGSAPYNNWLYASYITSHCRTQILNAIATHPGKSKAVLMVATDGICFDSPHPSLPISSELGAWERSVYTDLCLFKPGVYWHRGGKEKLLKVKSRGVPKAEFQACIDYVEKQFRTMLEIQKPPENSRIANELMYLTTMEDHPDQPWWIFVGETGWPRFEVPIKFRMKSVRQALNEHNWSEAGRVQPQITVWQDSDPQSKRRRPKYNLFKNRIDTIIHVLPKEELETKYYGEVEYPDVPDFGYDKEGDALDGIKETLGVVRKAPMHWGIVDTGEYEWELVWDSTQDQ